MVFKRRDRRGWLAWMREMFYPTGGFRRATRYVIHRMRRLPDRPLDVPAVLVASRNDPWMSFDRSQILAEDLGADLIDMGRAGHINVASGFGPWPGGKVIRDRLMDQTARPSILRRLLGQTPAARRPGA